MIKSFEEMQLDMEVAQLLRELDGQAENKALEQGLASAFSNNMPFASNQAPLQNSAEPMEPNELFAQLNRQLRQSQAQPPYAQPHYAQTQPPQTQQTQYIQPPYTHMVPESPQPQTAGVFLAQSLNMAAEPYASPSAAAQTAAFFTPANVTQAFDPLTSTPAGVTSNAKPRPAQGKPAQSVPGKAPARKGPITASRVNRAKKHRKLRKTGNIVFYICIIIVMFTALFYKYGGHEGGVFGYSFKTVLTTSMQSVYPKDSFIIVKEVSPKSLKIGDDITFYNQTKAKTITHRIIDIKENYSAEGKRGFVTKGVENPSEDGFVVPEDYVIGQVKFSVPAMGGFLDYIREHIWLPVVMFGIMITLTVLMETVWKKRRRKNSPPKGDRSPPQKNRNANFDGGSLQHHHNALLPCAD